MKNRKIRNYQSQKRVSRVFLVLGVCIVFCGVVLGYRTQRTEKRRRNELETQLEENRKKVYVAKDSIEAGELIEQDKVEYREVLADLPEGFFLQSEDIGRTCAVDVMANSYLLKSMILEESLYDDQREEEFSMFYLNRNLDENDYVDLRILYPNGENYIVVSKAKLRQLSLAENTCYLWLSEEEILMLHSAIVDTYLQDGTKLYTAKYLSPSVQEPSLVNYQPNSSVQKLMKEDPNIVSVASAKLSERVRAEMESRLEQYYLDHGEVDYNNRSDREYAGDNSQDTLDTVDEEEEIIYVE
ncbi:MAG: SAF domain-containing protein [Lachnospiraceae bacterium]